MWSTRNARWPHAVFNRLTMRRACSGQVGSAGTRSRRCTGDLTLREVVGERQDAVVPHIVGPLDQILLRAGVVQPDVGDGTTLLVVGLRRDSRAGVLFGHTALLDQPSQPHLDVGVHDDHQREQRRHSGFHQQRNVFDDNGVVGHRRDDLRAALAYQRVNDPVEPLARLVVAEKPWRPRPDDPVPRRAAGCRHRTRRPATPAPRCRARPPRAR